MSGQNTNDRWVDSNWQDIPDSFHEQKEFNNGSSSSLHRKEGSELAQQHHHQQQQQQALSRMTGIGFDLGSAFATATDSRNTEASRINTDKRSTPAIATTTTTAVNNIDHSHHHPPTTHNIMDPGIWTNPQIGGSPMDISFGLCRLSEAAIAASRIPTPTKTVASTRTATATRTGVPLMSDLPVAVVQKISVPAKVQLSEWYAKPPRYKIVNKTNYLTWQDGAMPHVARFTSIFLCPLTGETWSSGRYGDNSQDVHFYQVRHDPVTKAEIVWYKKKMWAEHAAAARALDCIMLREFSTDKHSLHNSKTHSKLPSRLAVEEPYMTMQEAPLMPSSMPFYIQNRIEQVQGGKNQQFSHHQSQTQATGTAQRHQLSEGHAQAQQQIGSAAWAVEQNQRYNDDYKAARRNPGTNSEESANTSFSRPAPQTEPEFGGGGSTINSRPPRQYNHEYDLFHAPDLNLENKEK